MSAKKVNCVALVFLISSSVPQTTRLSIIIQHKTSAVVKMFLKKKTNEGSVFDYMLIYRYGPKTTFSETFTLCDEVKRLTCLCFVNALCEQMNAAKHHFVTNTCFFYSINMDGLNFFNHSVLLLGLFQFLLQIKVSLIVVIRLFKIFFSLW